MTAEMDLLDRLLGHDEWTTRQLLEICAGLPEEVLDRDFEIGHGSLRQTFDHIIGNMEIWSALMSGHDPIAGTDQTVSGMLDRLNAAAERLKTIARQIADQQAWEKTWTDHLESPPREKRFGTSIAHVITHSMHHRAQILHMLRRCGVQPLPEGDLFSWEDATG